MRIMRTFLLTLTLSLVCGANSVAQENAPLTGATEEQKAEQQENEKRAFQVLEQVASEAQFLKLADNRIRVQITIADLLWSNNQERARSLFSLAGDGVAELIRTTDMTGPQPRRGQNSGRPALQLRQELVLRAARHDVQLAYHLMAATRPTAPTASTDGRNVRGFDAEANLEQSLLAQVAALDPKLAAQNTEQMLDKGEFPRSAVEVLRQLRGKDKEAASRLEDKLVNKLQSANLSANADAVMLALSLLRSGPADLNAPESVGRALLGPSSFQDLLGTFVESALKVNVANIPYRRGANRSRGRVSGVGSQTSTQGNADAQMEQMNNRRLLASLAGLLPQVEQYVPDRAAAVRQKLAETGMNDGRRAFGQSLTSLQSSPTSEALVAAAANAPPQMKSRLYKQAAMRALDEGNTDRARQIANDHLEGNVRESVMKALDLRQLVTRTEANRLDDVRMTLAQLPNDAERIVMLLQLSSSIGKKAPELALQLVEQAREYAMKRATSYENFEHQLRVAAAFTSLGSSRGFDVLEPGIMQLNELLSAAAVLSGFEVSVFRDGEMPLQGGSTLNQIVNRFAQQLGDLAQLDLERAQNLTNRFQFGEPRIMARLAMVNRLLGRDSVPTRSGPSNFVTFR
ncbi:MAG TPA: hypothetical protein VJ023_04575 [Pyrinomonadaceae bacterium]|nr:hypothetical protein [Pyrinomonadaceae bacterium]